MSDGRIAGELLAAARFVVVGKWIGGGWWESSQSFATEDEAWAWLTANPGVTPSENISIRGLARIRTALPRKASVNPAASPSEDAI